MTAGTRTATFAGMLGYGDFDLTSGGKPMATISVTEGVAFNGKWRSPRPYAMLHAIWNPEHAGLGIEETGREMAASPQVARAADEAGLPGDSLEVWLLPVAEFAFDYLITPAGDWPPEPAS